MSNGYPDKVEQKCSVCGGKGTVMVCSVCFGNGLIQAGGVGRSFDSGNFFVSRVKPCPNGCTPPEWYKE